MHLARRHHRRGRARRGGSWPRPSRPPSSTRSSSWADEIRKGKLGRAGQRRHRPRRRQRPRVRRRGHRPVPHRAHVPRRGPPAGRAPHDPGRHAAEEEAARSRSCGQVQQADFEEILEAMDGLPVTVRLLDPPLHEFLPVDRGAARSRRPRRASTDEEHAAARRRPAAGTSTTRCSAPAACASAS